MPHSERKHPDDSDIDVPYGEAVTEVWYEDGEWYGADDHGEFKLSRGSPHPVEEEDVGYPPCNCVVKFTFERYDERRFCTGPAIGGPTCKHHRGRAADGFLNRPNDLMKTGATAKSHKNVFRYMEPHEKVMANDLYKSLVELSAYDFEMENHELEVSDGDDGTMILNHPIPTEKSIKCKALWYAALDFVTMELMRKERFRTAFEQSRDASVDSEEIVPGERWQVVASGEQGAVSDKDEHHLNLALSRMQKDYEKELTFGGVEMEHASGVEEGGEGRDWHLTIVDETDTDGGYEVDQMHPDDVSPLEDVEPDT